MKSLLFPPKDVQLYTFFQKASALMLNNYRSFRPLWMTYDKVSKFLPLLINEIFLLLIHLESQND